MAADGEGARRARENDECEWFFNSSYKFRRLNSTYTEPGPLQIDPAAAAEQPQLDPQDDAAMQPEQHGQDAQLNLDDQHENEAMEVDIGN